MLGKIQLSPMFAKKVDDNQGAAKRSCKYATLVQLIPQPLTQPCAGGRLLHAFFALELR